MVVYNTLLGIQNYRNNPAVSQSELKAFLSGKKFTGESLSMMFGSYIDGLITMLPEEIQELYVVADQKRPSDTVVTLINQFKWVLEQYDSNLNPELSSYQNRLETFLQGKEWYPNLSPTAQATNLISKGGDWWNFIISSGDRTIITNSEKERLELIYQNLLDKFLRNGLEKGKSDQIDVYFQKELYWEEPVTTNGVTKQVYCKGLADIIIETDLSVVEIDIKYTDAKTLEGWIYIIRELNYPFQKAFYKKGIAKNYQSKTIKQYWLVISDNFIHMVPCTDLLLQIGEWGYQIHKETWELVDEQFHKVYKNIPGFREALTKWHKNEEAVAYNFELSEENTQSLFFK